MTETNPQVQADTHASYKRKLMIALAGIGVLCMVALVAIVALAYKMQQAKRIVKEPIVINATPVVTNDVTETPQIDIDAKGDYAVFLRFIIGTADLNESGLKDKLLQEQAEIRQKYKLPDRRIYKEVNSEYVAELDKVVSRESLNIQYDMTSFLASKDIDAGGIQAVYDSETNIIHLAEDFDETNASQVLTYEHEMLHALQYIYDPETLGDQTASEYEAFIAVTATPGRLEPKFISQLFENMYLSIKTALDYDNEPYPWLM